MIRAKPNESDFRNNVSLQILPITGKKEKSSGDDEIYKYYRYALAFAWRYLPRIVALRGEFNEAVLDVAQISVSELLIT